MYYDMDGREITLLQWADLYEGRENKKRILRQERLLWDKVFLSTVFLGIDHGFGLSSKPILFETMVFCEIPFGLGEYTILNHHDVGQWRYETKKQALAGHEKVKKSLTPLWFANHIIADHIVRAIKDKFALYLTKKDKIWRKR